MGDRGLSRLLYKGEEDLHPLPALSDVADMR